MPLYAVLVLAYGYFAWHLLDAWLFQLYARERKLYAVMALVLIIAQGYVLEILARALLTLIGLRRRKADR